MEFNKEYYPADIVETLLKLSNYTEEQKKEKYIDIENAIYYLLAAAENPYNKEYFRTLYRLLENIVDYN